ncbi:F-box/WD repeat-containing protein 9 [Galendromus occidentalis]|uniref:F-box/WD repeat-containing protein 9 n=1 Tax=Galendromus occidentalis TaxID=34638 RepID=A0AAJ6VYG8_9ACAR|nr:F-box/WD repeat-containing protein 9 [Galendromus occidentalis]
MASLEDLPNEILWHIFNFLEPSFVLDVLSEVSLRFRYLIGDKTLWRQRLFSKWPGKYPIPPPDWAECCREREEHWNAFHNWQQGGVRLVELKEAHIAAVDALRFIENGSFCVSGGRDHQLKVWKFDSEELVLHKRFNKSHSAWIWSIEQLDKSTLVSGSFDQTVKTWDIETEALLDTVTYPAAVLSLAQSNRLVACGTMGSKIHLQDQRAKSQTKCFEYHKNIVLTLAMDDEMIVSGSKDGTVAIFDLRAEKVANVQKLKGYPTAISHHRGQTWIGTSRGYVACLDTQTMAEPQVVIQKRISDKHIRSVNYSWGSVLVAAGSDRLIVLEPTERLTSITRQTIPGGITKAAMYNRTICAAGASGELLFWVPENDV